MHLCIHGGLGSIRNAEMRQTAPTSEDLVVSREEQTVKHSGKSDPHRDQELKEKFEMARPSKQRACLTHSCASVVPPSVL